MYQLSQIIGESPAYGDNLQLSDTGYQIFQMKPTWWLVWNLAWGIFACISSKAKIILLLQYKSKLLLKMQCPKPFKGGGTGDLVIDIWPRETQMVVSSDFRSPDFGIPVTTLSLVL